MFETEQLTIKQAALLAGKDEKTIRRWITHQKRLPVKKDRKGRYLVARLDIERIIREDEAVPLGYDEERIAALERRVSELEQKLERLESRPLSKTLRPPRIPYAIEASGEGLPDGWALLSTLIEQYHIGKQERKRIIRAMDKEGLLHRREIGGYPPKIVLDQEGQAEFLRRYRD